MTIRINRTRKTSPSARTLAEALDCKRLRLTNSRWRGKSSDLCINWGSSAPINVNARILNKPEAVAKSVNKLTTFDALEAADVPAPYFWEVADYDGLYDAFTYAFQTSREMGLPDIFLLRATATGHGGQGIYPLDFSDLESTEEEAIDEYLTDLLENDHWASVLPQTKFISSYFKAADEYRIHVVLGTPILSQRKALRTDDQRPEHPSFLIRNHDNGFVFTVQDVNPPALVLEQSIAAVSALGLDFGAVDIRYNPNTGKCCVLEVNSAPALQGTTLEVYAEAFTEIHTTLQELSNGSITAH